MVGPDGLYNTPTDLFMRPLLRQAERECHRISGNLHSPVELQYDPAVHA